jgi:subtilase family serine protease
MPVARWRAATVVAATAGALAVSGAPAGAAGQPRSKGLAARVEPIAAALPHQAQNDYSSCAALIAHGGHCYSPQVLQTAYGVTPLLESGVDGRGVTVVLPESAPTASQLRKHSPSERIFVRQSLASYDARFGLAAPRLRFDTKLDPGVPTSLDFTAIGEEILDVEMVHAIAPGATIDVELRVCVRQPILRAVSRDRAVPFFTDPAT